MSRLRKFAEIPAGSWTKWVIVGFWVVVLVLAFHRGDERWVGEERPEVLAARKCQVDQGPGRAVTLPVTQHLPGGGRLSAPLGPDRRGPGQGGRGHPEVRRDSRRRARSDRRPDPVGGRQGHADHPPGQLRHERAGPPRLRASTISARSQELERERPGLSRHRAARERGRQQQCVQGHRRNAVVLGRGRRHPDLADHLPEPGALAAAGDLVRGGADHRPGGDLPPRGQRRPRRQRAESGILEVLVFGASTDYALLIVARYREELRRHDRRHAAMAEALGGPARPSSPAAPPS